MPDNHEHRERALTKLKQNLQQRWGAQAVRPLRALQTNTRVSTGYPVLDQALGTDGVPYGKAVEIIAQPTSGSLSLALQILANCQQQHHHVAYIDLNQTFDPLYAGQLGVDLNHLLLVRPPNLTQALDISLDLLQQGGTSCIILDSLSRHTQPAAAILQRLNTALATSTCILIFLSERCSSESPQQGWVSIASLCLHLERKTWLHQPQGIEGYQVRVTILKNKLAPVAAPIDIQIIHSPSQHGTAR